MAGLGIATVTGGRAVIETKVAQGQRLLITGVAGGKLKVKADQSSPLAEASKGHACGEEGHSQGKIVLIVDAANANRR